MPDHRSPGFLRILLYGFIALGTLGWLSSGPIGAVICGLPVVPLIMEEAFLSGAGWRGARRYDRIPREIEQAVYSPAGALMRSLFLILFTGLALLLGRGASGILPESGWSAAFLLIPPVIYFLWSELAYRRNTAVAAEREGWPRLR